MLSSSPTGAGAGNWLTGLGTSTPTSGQFTEKKRKKGTYRERFRGGELIFHVFDETSQKISSPLRLFHIWNCYILIGQGLVYVCKLHDAVIHVWPAFTLKHRHRHDMYYLYPRRSLFLCGRACFVRHKKTFSAEMDDTFFRRPFFSTVKQTLGICIVVFN